MVKRTDTGNTSPPPSMNNRPPENDSAQPPAKHRATVNWILHRSGRRFSVRRRVPLAGRRRWTLVGQGWTRCISSDVAIGQR